MGDGSLPPGMFQRWKNRASLTACEPETRNVRQISPLPPSENGMIGQKRKMPDIDLVNRHPALQSMCSKD